MNARSKSFKETHNYYVKSALFAAELQQHPALSPTRELLTVHGNTIGLVDDYKVLVLVDNPSTQGLCENIGVDTLQLLSESH